jgi:hypothetical protein
MSLDGLVPFLMLLFGIPTLCIAALVILLILKIWCAFSWWWLSVPVVGAGIWYATVVVMGRQCRRRS